MPGIVSNRESHADVSDEFILRIRDEFDKLKDDYDQRQSRKLIEFKEKHRWESSKILFTMWI